MSFHAYPHGTRWAVRRSGRKRALMICDSRDEAWREARRRARAEGVAVYLHDETGRIVTRNSYEATEGEAP